MQTSQWTSLAFTGFMVTALLSTALWLPLPAGPKMATAHFAWEAPSGIVSGLTKVSLNQSADSARIATKRMSPNFKAVLNYDFDAVLQGHGEVPRVTLISLPSNLARIRQTAERKAVFFKMVLPLVLQINEQINNDRGRIKRLSKAFGQGTDMHVEDRLWLTVMGARYGIDRYDFAGMLSRHDGVAPSLALAQAATESAWGTSRFVREGNAMFGEWTFRASDRGIVPSGRTAGKSHRIRAFDSLYDSVYSYVTNLNKHRAYQEYRDMRSIMRDSSSGLDGMRLAGTLYRYSERGAAYVAEVRAIISSNQLDLIDGARLSQMAATDPLI